MRLGESVIMKTTQILYLVVFLGIIVSLASSRQFSDSEGYEDARPVPVNAVSEPTIPKGVQPSRLDIQAMPNSSQPGTLPFGPYAQQASVGSYQYQDPAQLPATLQQIRQLYQDLESFLLFEGASISNSSDPSVQLPFTQLLSDSKRLGEEVSVLTNNPGIQSSLTQQNCSDIRGALSYLQRKVRLFQTSGVINTDSKEGFQDGSGKTRATITSLQTLQAKCYAAILTLSSSGTGDTVVQARIKNLQHMYSSVSDMITKLNTGVWAAVDIPVFEEDINAILPNLDNPSANILMPYSKSGNSNNASSFIQSQLSNLVGKQNAKAVFNDLKENGMFRVNLELGYNVPGSKTESNGSQDMMKLLKSTDVLTGQNSTSSAMETSAPFDSVLPGAEQNNSKVGGLDWKKRSRSICEQVRLRGLDPQDFGCIPNGSVMSPAYSWRGYAKMICGRLGATMDPNLPVVCGCPPQHWPGWNSF